KSKVFFVLKKNQEPKVVIEFDSELNKWVNSIPEHHRHMVLSLFLFLNLISNPAQWDPDLADLAHFYQFASHLLLYHHLQMLIHWPFITVPCNNVHFSSLIICMSAALSCSHI
ncbi:hypothetical protein EDD85DRAFT_735766, partial [Armillaria nabsnona]